MCNGLLHKLLGVIALSLLVIGLSAGRILAQARKAGAKLTEAEVEARLTHLRELCQQNRRKEVVEQFENEDIAAWLTVFKDKNVAKSKAVDALNLRGTSFSNLGNYERAKQDFEFAVELSPQNGYMWNSLGGIYRRANDHDKALDAFNKAYEYDRAAHTKKSYGWMPISATLDAASILTRRTDYPEALKVLQHYNDDDIQKMGTVWGCKILRAYGQVYIATGREAEAETKFNAALKLEDKKPDEADDPDVLPNGTDKALDPRRQELWTRDRLYAGTAKVDITPPEEDAVDLVGRKLKLRDRLYARVLVLKTDETSLAIVSLDLILFSSAKVVAEAKKKWNVDHVLLCSTHTHAGMAPKGLVLKPHSRNDWTRAGDPGDMVDWPALSEDPWYAATEEKIVAAIGEAVKGLFPATLAGARGPYENPYMAHNRRLVGADGKARPMWRNPNRLPTKPIDSTMGVIQVSDTLGKPRALLVNYACHPVGSANSGYLHRDFPGAMVDYIEEQLGDDCLAMFTQGAEGDQDPYDMDHSEHGFNIIKYAGISLGKRALRLAKSLKARPHEAGAVIRVKESALDIKARRGNKASKVVITTVVINNSIALTSVPGEPFVQHQIDLRAKSPLETTFMLGLAYSGAGTPFAVYIPTAQAVKEGGYGATECSFVEARAGEMIVNEAAASIKELLPSEQSRQSQQGKNERIEQKTEQKSSDSSTRPWWKKRP